jgi:hypothetical protein
MYVTVDPTESKLEVHKLKIGNRKLYKRKAKVMWNDIIFAKL